jgi:tetratricopeptide (TPR) repeat protein
VVAVRDLIADRYFFSAEEALYRGDTDLAQAYLEQAVALDFCPRIDLYRLGTTYMQLGELEAARGIFYQSLNRFVPESLYVNLAQVETGFGNLAQARHFLEALLFTHPGRANELEARYLLAKIAVGERDYEQAEQDLQELLAIDRNFERAWVRLGDIAQATGRYPEAREHYQQALVVIDRKVKRLEGREPTTSKEYGEIRSQLELLYQVRAVVEQALSQLP